jgi:hypothetical protein
MVLNAQGRHDEAVALHIRALKLLEKFLGIEDFDATHGHIDLNGLDDAKCGRLELEPIHRRVLTILQGFYSPDHPDMARYYHFMGNFYRDQGKYATAEPLYRSALSIRERAPWPNRLALAAVIGDYFAMLTSAGDMERAAELRERLKKG